MSGSAIPRLVRNTGWHLRGRCVVCGRPTVFLCTDRSSARDNLFCVWCRSFARKRHLALLLLAELGAARSLAAVQRLDRDVYSAGVDGHIAAHLHRFARFTASELTDAPLGSSLPSGGTCQDLQALTFASGSQDVVVTEDVLEHVRHPDRAFAEIARVLRPGGVHLFTVPLYLDRATLERVEPHDDGSDRVLVEPLEYHGDARGQRVLAYRTFGTDLPERLAALGFETTLHLSRYDQRRLGIVDTAVFAARKATST
jgi:SAM-dependent methyltransferase